MLFYIESLTFYFISAIVIFFHSLLNYTLCGKLNYPLRFGVPSVVLFCLLNGLIGPIFLFTNYNNPTIQYFICTFILLSELIILFKGELKAILGVVFGSLLHLFVIRGIIIASASIYHQVSMHTVIHNTAFFPIVNLLSFVAQIFTLTLFIVLMPLKTVRKIMEDKYFYTSLLILALFLNAYMIFNSYMFEIDYFSINLAVQEIFISVFSLIFLYIMLLMLIRIFSLNIYKAKTKELETKIDSDKALATAVYNFAEVLIEINCTKDTIVRILVNGEEKNVDNLPAPDKLFAMYSKNFTHPQELDEILSINSAMLIDNFNNGCNEKLIDFRSKTDLSHSNEDSKTFLNNEYLWYRMRITTNLLEDTYEVFSIITVDEINEEKQAELSLRRKAETDLLTGAYNRQAFSVKVQEYMQNGGHGTLYMFDLDNFKGINDNMGHSMGDNVLKEVYAKTTAVFRENDIVARIGGDEFLVFMCGTTKESTIQKKAIQLCGDLHKTYHAQNGINIEISCSVGISIAPKHGTNFETLFDAADLSMYHSKSLGKNTFTIYNEKETFSFEKQEKEKYMRQRDAELTSENLN